MIRIKYRVFTFNRMVEMSMRRKHIYDDARIIATLMITPVSRAYRPPLAMIYADSPIDEHAAMIANTMAANCTLLSALSAGDAVTEEEVSAAACGATTGNDDATTTATVGDTMPIVFVDDVDAGGGTAVASAAGHATGTDADVPRVGD